MFRWNTRGGDVVSWLRGSQWRRVMLIAGAMAAVTFGAATPCHAGIAGVTGDIEVIDPPASVEEGDLETNTKIQVFMERSNFVLPVAVNVDILGRGLADLDSHNTPPTPGQIPAGTRVDVFMVHFDTPGNNDQGLFGQISTDTDILGTIHTDVLLDASDPILGRLDVSYPTGIEFRGMVGALEGSDFVDVVNTPNGVRGVHVLSEVEFQLDQIRVITVASVPEPASLALLGLGGLAMLKRRRA